MLWRFGLIAWAVGLLALHSDPGTVLLGVAAVAAAAMLVRLLGAVPATAAATLTGPVLRARSLRTAHHPQRDPDAAGRPRPRAPSASPLTA